MVRICLTAPLSEDVVKRMVAAAYDKQDALAAGHKAWAQMKPDIENFQKLGAPMHPGAEAYYREQGQWPE